MQNTIVKEFAGNPEVFTAVFQQGGANGETRAWLEVFWSNYFLRGGVIWDETGTTGRDVYGQPGTGLPFGRGFIIDRDGRVDRPYFGHQPQMAIARIHLLLGTSGLTRRPERPFAARVWFEGVPSPFAPPGDVVFGLAEAGRVRLEIHDALGRRLGLLLDAELPAGRHRVGWSGTGASGVYYARLRTSGGADVRRLTLVR